MRFGALLLLAFLGIAIAACGGDGGNNSAPSGTQPDGVRELSEEEFPAARDTLANRLDGIGVSIGAAPEDVRRALLADCGSLASQADDSDVEAICSAIRQAMDSNDSGLIDLVIAQLRALERD